MIRKATKEDLNEIMELYGAVCDYLEDKPFNPGFRRGGYPNLEAASFMLSDDGLYVDVRDGKIVGSMGLTHRPTCEEDRDISIDLDVLYLHILVVHPDYLRCHIATDLLIYADEVAMKEKVQSIQLDVASQNDVAIHCYEKNGYQLVCKRDLGLEEFGSKWFYLYKKSFF